jgi:hypothetical protein
VEGLGCSKYKSEGKLGPMKRQDLKSAKEWVEGYIKEYGDSRKEGKSFLAINFQLHMLKRVK